MNTKRSIATLSVIAVIWHVVSISQDIERYKLNLHRWQAAPTRTNLFKLLVAEGVVTRDIGSLF